MHIRWPGWGVSFVACAAWLPLHVRCNPRAHVCLWSFPALLCDCVCLPNHRVSLYHTHMPGPHLFMASTCFGAPAIRWINQPALEPGDKVFRSPLRSLLCCAGMPIMCLCVCLSGLLILHTLLLHPLPPRVFGRNCSVGT